MNWHAIAVTLLQQTVVAAVFGTFLYFITRSAPMRNDGYQGPGKYDVRLTVDEAYFTLTVHADSRAEAPGVAEQWARNNFRERVYTEIEAEVIRPNQD